jgi:hypothetical protein
MMSDWIPVALLTAAGVAFWHWCRLLWDRYNTRYHYTREEWRPEPWPDQPPDFDAIKRSGGTFVAGREPDFDAYLAWADRQVCEHCGRPALGPDGKREVLWQTETECQPCCERRMLWPPRDEYAKGDPWGS